jgi:uncharacterized membrane protein YtjA (UPF0391 family)
MNWKKTFLILAIISLFIGFIPMGSIVNGIGKACFGVFFILYYIFMLFGNEISEKH